MKTLPVESIKIGSRKRKDLGDLSSLMQSIEKVGLLHPIVVDPDGKLIAGHRRLEAFKKLKRDEIPVTVVKNLEEAYSRLIAERDENEERKPTVPSEKEAIADALEPFERAAAKERKNAGQKSGGRGKKKNSEESFLRVSQSRDRVARAAGTSAATLKKIREVTKAAREDPTLAPIVEKMDRTGKVDGAYRDLKLHRAKEKVAEQAKQAPEQARIKTADCASFLKTLKERSVDLLLTDPPYSTDVDDINKFSEWILDAMRKLKLSGRAYVCIGAYPKELYAYLGHLERSRWIDRTQILVWTYRNTMGPTPKNDYKLNWQAVLYIQGWEAPPLDSPIMLEQFSVQDINAPDGRLGDRIHAWQKPDELAERFVRHSTKPGDLVVDPFAGTGTFLLAASRLGRKTIGCDQDPAMVKIAKSRGCVNG